MRVRLALAAGLAGTGVVVLLAGLGLGWWSGGAAAAQPRPLTVRTSLSPRPSLFGDRIAAEVDVLLDWRAAAPGSLRVHAGFAPYAQTGPVVVRASAAGADELVRYRYTLSCLTDACLPLGGVRVLRFPPVRVTAAGRDRRLAATVAWPTALVASRLRPADLAGDTPRFRAQTHLPAFSYAVAPGPLAAGLTTTAGLLAAASLLLVGREAVRLRARRVTGAASRLTPLEAALAYTREAARRPDPPDRRKALGLLARVLERDGDERLVEAAGALAWAEPFPTPERTEELADEVERALGGRR